MNRAALLAICLITACATPPRAPEPEPGPAEPPAEVPQDTLRVDPPRAGEPADVTAVCAKVACRDVAAVGQRMPYAFETDVILAWGETFSVEGEVRDGLLVNLGAKPGSGAPLTLSWSNTRVTLTNRFSRRLRYRAMVLRTPDAEFEDLDACAIAPGQESSLEVPRNAPLFAVTSLEHVSGVPFDACEKGPDRPSGQN